jgi:hypothetical protein
MSKEFSSKETSGKEGELVGCSTDFLCVACPNCGEFIHYLKYSKHVESCLASNRNKTTASI